MEKNSRKRLSHGKTLKYNKRKYRVNSFSCIILPDLEELRKYVVNNGSVMLMHKNLIEYIINNGSVPVPAEDQKEYIINNDCVSVSVEDWRKYIADNGSVPFILDELEESIVDSDELSSMPKGVRKYIIGNGRVLLMLDELRKYLVDNDMIMLIPEKRWKYGEEVARRNKEPKQHTIKQIFKDALVERKQSKTIDIISFLDRLIQAANESVSQNEEKEMFRTQSIEVFEIFKRAFQYRRKFSYALDYLGEKVVKLHAYTCGYEKMMEDSKNTKCDIHGKEKYVNRANKILGAIHKNAGLPWNVEQHKRDLAKLYTRLVKRYGRVMNADTLCFIYMVYSLDWKGIKSREAESNIIAILFSTDGEPDVVPKNLHGIYKECYGESVRGNNVYIKLYDIVEKVVKGEELGRNATMADIDRCRNFLMKMYVEIIIKIRCLIGGKENKNARCLIKWLIKREAAPFFCNVLCSVRKYERMKMLSLMMQLTRSMMLDEDDGQKGTVRSGCTDYFRFLYRLMVLNSKTLDKDIMNLGNLKVADARKQCERAIRKEFKGITIPEWPDDRKLSPAAKRFNCMMLMVCFIVCKHYQNPSDYSVLLYWLVEIWELYDNRMRDLHSTECDWTVNITIKYVHMILCRKYCESIVYNFSSALADKKLNIKSVLGNYIWNFQQDIIDLEILNKSISEEYWDEDSLPWIPAGYFDSKDELKKYLEDDSNLEIVPTVSFAEEIDCLDI